MIHLDYLLIIGILLSVLLFFWLEFSIIENVNF